MPEVRILYWRDIPAQVIVGEGRAAAKARLSHRFEDAIDACVLRGRDAEAYRAEWRPGEAYVVDGDVAEIAAVEVERIEFAFPVEAVRTLVANEGWAEPRA